MFLGIAPSTLIPYTTLFRSDALEEYEVVRRGLRAAADRGDGRDHVGKQRRPMERLLRAHREAGDEPDPLDAEALGQQPMLRDDVVVDGDMRERRAIDRRRRVAW